MKEYTLTINNINYFKDYSELFDYLFDLNGVQDVIIDCDDAFVNITVKYNQDINDEIIRLEILYFLDITNYPCIYGFDKHPNGKEMICEKIKYTACCDFCHGNIIYTLIDTPGIEKVESDFNLASDGKTTYTVTIYYNPKILTKKKYQDLRKKIDVYG